MSAHTPGPWEACEADGFFVSGPDHTEPVICDIVTRVDVETVDFDGEDWANARLIAAAPDLLEAAVHVLAKLDHPTHSVTMLDADKLRAAIAKATGGDR